MQEREELQFLTIAKQTVEDSELSNGIKICKKV